MLPGLNRRHLFEKIFASKESNAGEEGEDSNSYPVITSIVVSVVKTNVFSVWLFYVSLVAYASEHDYREELKD